jgi:hypothetical protein
MPIIAYSGESDSAAYLVKVCKHADGDLGSFNLLGANQAGTLYPETLATLDQQRHKH